MTIDRHSGTWTEVKDWAEDRLRDCRDALEVPGTPDDRSDELRGRIAELKALLDLPAKKDMPRPDPSGEDYGLQGADLG